MERHKYKSIYNWKRYGVISEDYDKLYENHMNINNCELCNIEFNNIIICNRRTLDHDHNTGLYRQTICHKCNRYFDNKIRIDNTSGHKNISYCKFKNKYMYEKSINKKRFRRSFETLDEALDFKNNFESLKLN